MTARDLLFEIGTEELPPRALSGLSAALEQAVTQGLEKEGLSFRTSRRYATPRRLAVLVSGLADQQADRTRQRIGPALKTAFDDRGNPTPAALGFAKSCNVEVSALDTLEKDGVRKLAYSVYRAGKPAVELIPPIISSALAQLPVPKRMRWGSSREEFVRPVHWAALVFGQEIIPMSLLGVETSHFTYGHRFHYNREILIKDAADYEELLEENGGVIPDFRKRQDMIRKLVTEEGAKIRARTVIDEDLLEEVTSLVEYPVALTGAFDEHFLEVPAEALILALKSHQKCFYLVDGEQNMLPNFVTVSNIVSRDPDQVIKGNERVIRPRLADARFFYETDKQTTLEARQEQLRQIVFQEKLGTIHDKTRRVVSLSHYLAGQLNADPDHCARAAALAKCDLVTNMVAEFADLQGLMGYYYALHDGEAAQVAQALKEQYMPRFSGDKPPESLTGSILAMADKLDTVVGLFGIGQPPTGSRDPFALRRSAIGVLRIIVEKQLNINLLETIEVAAGGFTAGSLEASTVPAVFEFMLERFRAWYVDEGISAEVFQSVFALRPPRPLDFHRRIQAVHKFSELPEASALAAANKRVSNLLAGQTRAEAQEVNRNLLKDQAEKDLFSAIDRVRTNVNVIDGQRLVSSENPDYQSELQELASLNEKVGRFFDEVLVMCDDEKLRDNRLALLRQLRDLFLRTADVSCLHKT